MNSWNYRKPFAFVVTLLGFLAFSALNVPQVDAALQVLDFGAFANGQERGYGFGDHITVTQGTNLPVGGVGLSLYAWNLINGGTLEGLPTTALGTSTNNQITAGATLAGGTPYNKGPYAYMDSKSSGRLSGSWSRSGVDGQFSGESGERRQRWYWR